MNNNFDHLITTFINIDNRRQGMRRGMLMTVLHQYAIEQPVWKGKPGER